MSKVSVPDDLRDLLGTDVRFESLSPEDQVKLHKAVTNLAVLGQVGVKTLRSRAKDAVEAQFLDKPLRDVITNRPMLTQVLGGKEGGPLGLGLLDALLGGGKKEEPKPGPPAESSGAVVEATETVEKKEEPAPQ